MILRKKRRKPAQNMTIINIFVFIKKNKKKNKIDKTKT